jgi:hypothetical protein
MSTAHAAARKQELESFLLETQGDQGGEASFADWLQYTIDHDTEFGHEEAVEYAALAKAGAA